MKVLPEEEILKNKIPDWKLFGVIPVSYRTKMIKRLSWIRAQNLDADLFVSINREDKFNASSIIINVLPEFTKRVYTLNHITVSDLFTRIGGFRAALGPLFEVLSPIFVIYFLNYLAKVIGEKMADSHQIEMDCLCQ